MSDRGVVFDLGYAPHEGPRLGTAAAIRATIKDGVRRVLGLRRKARKKIGPWLLFAGSLIPAIVFVGLAFFWAEFELPGDDSPFGGHVEYFSLNGTLVLIFAALAGPELLIPDRVEGVLSVYASRPMRARDYLMARAGALAVVLSGFLLVPQLLLYLGLSALDADGFFSALVNRSDDLVQIVLTSLVYMAGYGAPALLIASFARRNAPATGIYFAVMFILTGFAQGMLEGDVAFAEWVSLAALAQHPEVVRDWIFDRSSQDLAPVDAGWDPWVSLAVIVGVVIVTVFVASRRYRREM